MTTPSALFSQARASLALLCFCLSGMLTAQAQVVPPVKAPGIDVVRAPKVLFPPGLSWTVIPQATADARLKEPTPGGENAQARAFVQKLWSDELKKDQSGFRTAILLGQTRLGETSVKLSLINLYDFERCQPPLDGKNVVDLYSRCLMRVHVQHGQRVQVSEFKDVCNLHVDYDDKQSLKDNSSQMAVDSASRTIYLRVMQYGKLVPACNLALRFSGV